MNQKLMAILGLLTGVAGTGFAVFAFYQQQNDQLNFECAPVHQQWMLTKEKLLKVEGQLKDARSAISEMHSQRDTYDLYSDDGRKNEYIAIMDRLRADRDKKKTLRNKLNEGFDIKSAYMKNLGCKRLGYKID